MTWLSLSRLTTSYEDGGLEFGIAVVENIDHAGQSLWIDLGILLLDDISDAL